MHKMKTRYLSFLFIIVGTHSLSLLAEEVTTPPNHVDKQVFEAEVDWFQELRNGGNTSIALGLLCMGMIGFSVERLMRLRSGAISPQATVDKVIPLWREQKFGDISKICDERPSTLSRIIHYLVEHRQANPDMLIAGAGDILVREMKEHAQKAFPLAVIASLAPLLGLLGTMIGMIESFKLVEVYGDAGGASMLAGSISKALITTAAGLIIAIPALVLYHFFKFRTNQLGNQLEMELEQMVNHFFLKPDGTPVKENA